MDKASFDMERLKFSLLRPLDKGTLLDTYEAFKINLSTKKDPSHCLNNKLLLDSSPLFDKVISLTS